MVLNAKGGSGKSTLATNLASYYAAEQSASVALADFDPQGSSSEWLTARGDERPAIHGIRAWEHPVRPPRDTDYLVIDAPSRTAGRELCDLLRRAETVLIPVLPSPIDMRAAANFIRDLLLVGRVSRQQTRVAVIANRVREHTRVYQDLHRFLERLRIPFVAHLRDTQNYIRAAERGVGIFELAPSTVEQDLEQWEPLLKWLRSKRSRVASG